MNEFNPDVPAALRLEDMKFMQWLSESSRKNHVEIEAVRQKMAARNYGNSGLAFKGEVAIILDSVQENIDKAIEYRLELGQRVPPLLESPSLKTFNEKMDRHVDSAVNAIHTRATMRARGAGLSSTNQELQQRAYSIKAQTRQRLAALELESKLGMHSKGPTIMASTFNISNNTIANLNLGNVMGDLNGSIEQLNSGGQKDMAAEFAKMADAIGASKDISDEAKKELLEHLSVVSCESAKPAEQRKMGPVKTSIEAIKSGIIIAGQLVTAWQGLEHALKAAGMIHG